MVKEFLAECCVAGDVLFLECFESFWVKLVDAWAEEVVRVGGEFFDVVFSN